MKVNALGSEFSGKRILVTGGTGMIGRQVVRLLLDHGARVTIASLDRIQIHQQVEHVYGDLTDPGFCRKITSGMDGVFHVAGIKGSVQVTKSRPASFFVPLLLMNTNVLEACRINKVPKVLYTSSVGAYSAREVFKEDEDAFGSEPMDLFPGWAKRMAELQIRAYNIQYGLTNFAIVRPSNVYGPGDNFDPDNAMVVPSLMSRVYRGEDPVLVWGDGSAVRDFAYSEDVAWGMLLALWHGTSSRPVNLGSGRGYSIRELVEALHSVVPFNYRFDTSKPSGFPRRVMDITLARQTLGYEPRTSLEDGLRQTWDWYVRNQDEHLKKQNYFKD